MSWGKDTGAMGKVTDVMGKDTGISGKNTGIMGKDTGVMEKDTHVIMGKHNDRGYNTHDLDRNTDVMACVLTYTLHET